MSVTLTYSEKKYSNHTDTIRAINQVLAQHGLKVGTYSDGPRATRFIVPLHTGVNVSKLKKINDYMCIALGSNEVRTNLDGNKLVIEARTNDNKVDLAELWTNDYIRQQGIKLMLGKGMDGLPLYADLVKCKHMLVAGATGSGKSMFLHELIISMLVHNPALVQLVMVDMKGTEFIKYDSIPWVRTIDTVQGAVNMANQLIRIMDKRYKTLAKAKCRDIDSYNSKGGNMSRIVFIIDEYADLILTAKKTIQDPIIRLAQKARACGIHLIIATQKPTSNVINTLIKANLPTKICLKVNTSMDSRVVLDRTGGEKLLGNGDMLFLKDGSFEPIRIQGCFISEEEIDAVVNNTLDSCNILKSQDYREVEETPKPKLQSGFWSAFRKAFG